MSFIVYPSQKPLDISQGEQKDLLFLVFERYLFCVLEYVAEANELRTRANGELSDKIGVQLYL